MTSWKSKRRTYRIIVRIHKATDRPGSPNGEVVAKASKRARLGIFQVNEWREIAKRMVESLGFEMWSQYGHYDHREWGYIAFIYGSFDPNGVGRCLASLHRIPARRLHSKYERDALELRSNALSKLDAIGR